MGDTVYNLLGMQSLDTDVNDRPNDPPFIRKVKVVINPFEDIKPRNMVPEALIVDNR
jgi:peptidyl-prolyl cis-trans isomerase SDCCAG10